MKPKTVGQIATIVGGVLLGGSLSAAMGPLLGILAATGVILIAAGYTLFD